MPEPGQFWAVVELLLEPVSRVKVLAPGTTLLPGTPGYPGIECWRPSECLGEDQPGHRIHLRTGYDQLFENATKLPDISGFQAVSESTDAR